MNIFSYNIKQLLTEFGTAAVFFDSRTDSFAEGNRSVRGSNKTAAVREASLYLYRYALSFFQYCLIPLTNRNSFLSCSSSLRIWKTSLLLTLILLRQTNSSIAGN